MIKANYTIYECVAFCETNNNIECGGMFSKCLQKKDDFEMKWNEMNWTELKEKERKIERNKTYWKYALHEYHITMRWWD